jgi:hypothetical protein
MTKSEAIDYVEKQLTYGHTYEDIVKINNLEL